MLQIDHRESQDIDVFIDDPQLLADLNGNPGICARIFPTAMNRTARGL